MKKLTLRGFTLIELLVVIAIIGILTAIVVGNFGQAKAKSRDAKRISDIANLQLALELYFDRCNAYPSNLTYPGSNCSGGGVNLGYFISQIPNPPTNISGYGYDYYVSSDTLDYRLRTGLEVKNTSILQDSVISNGSVSGVGTNCNSSLGSSNPPYNYCVAPK